jgi:hypothetical protein
VVKVANQFTCGVYVLAFLSGATLAQTEFGASASNLPESFHPATDFPARVIPYWRYTGANRLRLFFTSLVDPRSVANLRLITAYSVPLEQIQNFRVESSASQLGEEEAEFVYFLPLNSGQMIELPGWVVSCEDIVSCVLPSDLERILEEQRSSNLIVYPVGPTVSLGAAWQELQFIVGPGSPSIRPN